MDEPLLEPFLIWRLTPVRHPLLYRFLDSREIDIYWFILDR